MANNLTHLSHQDFSITGLHQLYWAIANPSSQQYRPTRQEPSKPSQTKIWGIPTPPKTPIPSMCKITNRPYNVLIWTKIWNMQTITPSLSNKPKLKPHGDTPHTTTNSTRPKTQYSKTPWQTLNVRHHHKPHCHDKLDIACNHLILPFHSIKRRLAICICRNLAWP